MNAHQWNVNNNLTSFVKAVALYSKETAPKVASGSLYGNYRLLVSYKSTCKEFSRSCQNKKATARKNTKFLLFRQIPCFPYRW